VRRVVRRGVEPKAQVSIVFTGPFEFTPENRALLSGVAQALELRLQDVLREELSGTYGVGVDQSTRRDPRPDYSFSIGFSGAPDRIEALTAATFKEIEKMQTEGPTAEEVQKLNEMRRRSRETSLKQNGYWLGQLLFADRYGPAFRGGLGADTGRPYDQASLREAAKRYLRADNFVQVTLLPEARS
jgi:zinc protease